MAAKTAAELADPPASIGAAVARADRRREPEAHRRLLADRPALFASSGARPTTLLGRLPKKAARKCRRKRARPSRSSQPRASSASVFSRAHAETLYDELTRDSLALHPRRGAGLRRGRDRSRPDADRGPGRRRGRAACSATRTASRSTRAFSSRIFSASETAGRHLCHAMLLPRPETDEHLAKTRSPTAASISARSGSSAAARRSSDHVEQSALPQRRGRYHARRDGDRGRRRHSRSEDRHRRAARRRRSIIRNIAAASSSAPASI